MDVEDEEGSRRKMDEIRRSCRRSCETSKGSRVPQKKYRKASKSQCSTAARGGEKEA